MKAQCGQLIESKRESWDWIARPLLVLSLTLYHSLFLVLSEFQGLPLPPDRAGGTGERALTAGHCRVAWQSVSGQRILVDY